VSAAENKAVVRRIEEAWDADQLDALDPLFEPGFVQHNGVPGLPPGLEGAKAAHNMSRQAFPDRRTRIEDIVAEGDEVAVRMRMTGTNQGGLPWFGIPANGKSLDIEWISIYRLANGKVVEHRAVMDLMGLMQQLGAMPAPGEAPAARPA
jgi:predicted ester cyclase